MGNKTGAAHLIPLVVILVFTLLLVGALYYTKVLHKNLPSISSQTADKEASVQVKSEYANPFDKNSQYVNPFAQAKNPFDNLK